MRSRLSVLALGCALGCARTAPVTTAPVTTTPVTTAPATPVVAANAAATAPSEAPAPAVCPSDELPPAELFVDNAGATSMTGLAEIVASSKTGPGGKGPAPARGYVTFRYEVRVLEWFSGGGPNRMVLMQMAEADLRPKAAGNLLLFSACASGGAEGAGEAYEPDVGYFFPLDPACRAEAEALGAAAAKRKRRKGKTPEACKK